MFPFAIHSRRNKVCIYKRVKVEAIRERSRAREIAFGCHHNTLEQNRRLKGMLFVLVFALSVYVCTLYHSLLMRLMQRSVGKAQSAYVEG